MHAILVSFLLSTRYHQGVQREGAVWGVGQSRNMKEREKDTHAHGHMQVQDTCSRIHASAQELTLTRAITHT